MYHNISKVKNHIVISIDAENTFDDIQNLFMIIAQQVRNEELELSQLYKDSMKKTIANIVVNEERVNASPSKIRNKAGVSTCYILIQHSTENFS